MLVSTQETRHLEIPHCRIDMIDYGKSFASAAQQLISLSQEEADRCRSYYLNPSSLFVSNDVIGASCSSEILRGELGVKSVAVKRLELAKDVVKDVHLRQQKDLAAEIDFMCRSEF